MISDCLMRQRLFAETTVKSGAARSGMKFVMALGSDKKEKICDKYGNFSQYLFAWR